MALFEYILKLSLSGSVLISAVIPLRFIIRKCPKIYSYLLWLVVFSALVFRVTVTVPAEYAAVNYTVAVDRFIDIPVTQLAGNAAEAPILPANPTEFISIKSIAFSIWLVGFAVLFAAYLKSIVDIIAVTSRSYCNKNDIYYNEYIKSPFTFGFLQPKIYIPADISVGEEGYIIAHERVHIKRRDYIVKPLCFTITMLHWFNPLVWLAFGLMTKDMELSCDEAVIKNMDADGRKEYCNVLLSFGIKNKPYKINAVLFGEGDCSMRIKNVLNYKKPSVLLSVLLCLTVAMVGCAAVDGEKEAFLPEGKNDSIFVVLDDKEEESEKTEEKSEATEEYIFPTAEGVRISRGFAGQYPSHDGLDIAGATGTEIYATAAGTVVTAEESTKGDGNHIIIDHGDGLQTLYAHCDNLLVKRGNEVGRGQLIATMGNTGNSTGPHLHFECILNDVSIDPYRLIGEEVCPDCGGRCGSGAYEPLTDWQEAGEVDCITAGCGKAKHYKREYRYNILCPQCGQEYTEKGTDEKIICDTCFVGD